MILVLDTNRNERELLVLLCGIIKIMNVTGRIETSQQICRNQANTSSAKQQWSFSKAPRFAAYRGYTNTISYELPDSKSKRKAGIGVGNRSKHFDGVNTANPSPFKYQAKSDFERKQERRGYSFTCNRDDLKYANYLQQSEDTPAAYGINEKQTKKNRSYSMRPKTAYPQNCNPFLMQTSFPTSLTRVACRSGQDPASTRPSTRWAQARTS